MNEKNLKNEVICNKQKIIERSKTFFKNSNTDLSKKSFLSKISSKNSFIEESSLSESNKIRLSEISEFPNNFSKIKSSFNNEKLIQKFQIGNPLENSSNSSIEFKKSTRKFSNTLNSNLRIKKTIVPLNNSNDLIVDIPYFSYNAVKNFKFYFPEKNLENILMFKKKKLKKERLNSQKKNYKKNATMLNLSRRSSVDNFLNSFKFLKKKI